MLCLIVVFAELQLRRPRLDKYRLDNLLERKAKEGVKDVDPEIESAQPTDAARTAAKQRRAPEPQPADAEPLAPRQADKAKAQDDADANVGSDFDASDLPIIDPPENTEAPHLTIPNAVFLAARILVNPRCVTTYAGVSHTQLALDLFGPPDREEEQEVGRQDVLEDWEGAPDTFVCQEQRCAASRHIIGVLGTDRT